MDDDGGGGSRCAWCPRLLIHEQSAGTHACGLDGGRRHARDVGIASPVPQAAAQPVASTAPVVTAEADLYAVHPERVIDRAVAHAEWFVAEYLTMDGTEEGRAALTALLPAGVPMPAAADGTRVFVEWVRASAVEEIGQLVYRVTVLARSLAAAANAEYQRQAPLQVEVDVSMAGDGAQVVMAPQVSPAQPGPAHQLALVTVPEDVGATALQQSGGSEVSGACRLQTGAGKWSCSRRHPMGSAARCRSRFPLRDQLPNSPSRIEVASGMIDSQGMSEVLEMVTKSAVRKMLVTPGMARRSRAKPSSGGVRRHASLARQPAFPR